MSYTISVSTTHEGEELVSCFLQMMGAEGVSILDAFDLQELLQNKSHIFWDYVEDDLLKMDEIVQVTAFFDAKPTKEAVESLRTMLDNARKEMPVELGSLEIVQGESLHDDDWLENWRQFYHPIKVGNVTVLPAWIEEADTPINVKIDPSTAFGTGEHESTKMCIDLLQQVDLKGKDVIDVGCGSGILGIASLKIGAENCYFCDLDPDAIKNCRQNIAINSVKPFDVRIAPLLKDCPLCADVILANITADVLLLLAKEIRSYQKAGGYLIVSGIIAGREKQVVQAFEKIGYRVRCAKADNDWRAYLLQALWN